MTDPRISTIRDWLFCPFTRNTFCRSVMRESHSEYCELVVQGFLTPSGERVK